MLNQFGVSEIRGAQMSGFRLPSDEETEAGIAALEGVVGPAESARMSWRRRLCILPSGEWGLLLDECGFLSAGALIQFTPGSVTATPVALPIADAVALLRSPANPEIELQRRRTFLADLNARHAKQAEDERDRQLASSARQQDAEARAKTYRWDQWAQLTDWQRLAYSLALALDEGEDPALALRRIAGSVTSFHGARATPLPPPNAQWWL